MGGTAVRIRTIKPSYFKNEDLAELPHTARLLFIGLWCLADCDGRLEDRPKRIRAELFSYENLDVNEYLQALAGKGFIVRYRVGEVAAIEIPTFRKHQRISGKEASTRSNLPPPPTGPTQGSSGEVPEKPMGSTGEQAGKQPVLPGSFPVVLEYGVRSMDSPSAPPLGESGGNSPGTPPGRRPRAPKHARVRQSTFLMERVGGWFRRRPGTLWTEEEARLLHEAVGNTPPAEDIDLMERYYKADIPRDTDYRRRDLATLLRHWSGELDRARGWQAEQRQHEEGGNIV